jgi:hypothetical protein
MLGKYSFPAFFSPHIQDKEMSCTYINELPFQSHNVALNTKKEIKFTSPETGY